MISIATLNHAFLLLLVYQVKHFIADFPLQFPYMLRKFRPGWDFVLPLTMHCLVHGAITLMICLVVNPRLWWLSLFDFVAHFIMDRIKSGPRYLGRFKDSTTTLYWFAFGFDQMVHHITHMIIVYILIRESISPVL